MLTRCGLGAVFRSPRAQACALCRGKMITEGESWAKEASGLPGRRKDHPPEDSRRLKNHTGWFSERDPQINGKLVIPT